MDFKSYLQVAAQEIEQETNKILNDWVKEVEKISPKLVPLTQHFIESCQGGKRLRGALVKLGWEIADKGKGGSGKGQEVTIVASAYEIFQTAILAHDDVIDLSSTRRGKQTLYMKLGGDHYGISQTIGLGDVGLYLPIKIITGLNLPDNVKNKAVSFFAQVVIETGLGEVLDVELPHLKVKRAESDVIAIHTLKTARYTISGPLVLGGILAGVDPETMQKIKLFGEYLGIAFQIQDDILGVFGDEQVLGKSVTSDIEEGKNTLLITQALKKADKKQKDILDEYYGKREINLEEVAQIKTIFTDTKALEYSEVRAGEYVKMAKKLIPEITHNIDHQNLLEQMSDYLVNRSK